MMKKLHSKISLGPGNVCVAFACVCLFSNLSLAQSGSRLPASGSGTRIQSSTQPGQIVYPSQGSASRTKITYPQGEVISSQPMSGTVISGQPMNGSTTRSSISGGSTTRRSNVLPTVETFEQKFWNYLLRAKYRNWAPVPGQSDAMYEGQSPHGAYLKMYLNRTAAGNPSKLPSGSIIIKENYGADQKTLMAITAMYKNKGYNPSGDDWYWVKFNPDGSVASKNTESRTKRLAGRVQGCISCHDGADGNDFTFFND